MSVPTDKLKELRQQTGAGIMACRNAYVEAGENMEKAIEILKENSLNIVEKKKDRSTSQGIIDTYVHTGGRIAAMVELNCETDFVARTDEFQKLAHNLAMQVAAMPPQFVNAEDAPADADPKEVCLMEMPYIRDLSVPIKDVVNEIIAKVGENIRVSRFARFELGE